jgi:hypothetical protein
MTWEEYQKTRDFMERKALALMDHEGKAMVKAGLPIDNYTGYIIKERTFYAMKSNVFKDIMRNVLMQAHKKFPERFGTDDAQDVLKALHEIEPTFEFERYIEFLRDEQFAYIIEVENGEVIDRILRIDIFRRIDTNMRGKPEFTGGIFHALKHFSIDGKNLSTGNDVHDIGHPEYIIRLATEAFFVADGEFETSTKYISKISLDNKYNLKFVFYLEENTKVFFIKTIHKEPK